MRAKEKTPQQVTGSGSALASHQFATTDLKTSTQLQSLFLLLYITGLSEKKSGKNSLWNTCRFQDRSPDASKRHKSQEFRRADVICAPGGQLFLLLWIIDNYMNCYQACFSILCMAGYFFFNMLYLFSSSQYRNTHPIVSIWWTYAATKHGI